MAGQKSHPQCQPLQQLPNGTVPLRGRLLECSVARSGVTATARCHHMCAHQALEAMYKSAIYIASARQEKRCSIRDRGPQQTNVCDCSWEEMAQQSRRKLTVPCRFNSLHAPRRHCSGGGSTQPANLNGTKQLCSAAARNSNRVRIQQAAAMPGYNCLEWQAATRVSRSMLCPHSHRKGNPQGLQPRFNLLVDLCQLSGGLLEIEQTAQRMSSHCHSIRPREALLPVCARHSAGCWIVIV